MKAVHFGGDLSREQGAEKEWKSFTHAQLDQLPLWQVEFHPTGELWEPGYNRPPNYPNPGSRKQHIYPSSPLTHCLREDS